MIADFFIGLTFWALLIGATAVFSLATIILAIALWRTLLMVLFLK